MASFCSAWRRSSILFMLLCVLVAQISTCFSSKVYVVYMGSKNGEDPDEILAQNHQILASVHTGSIEEAQASHIHSYRHGFKGFAARLTDQQAFQISKMPGVVSVFPNSKRSLHTTHSWDFMGLLGEQTLEVSGFNIKNQVNVIVGFIDTGIWPESPSFNDDNMPPVPARWKGICQSGEAFNASTCNRKVIGARYYKSGYEAEEDSADTVAFSSPRDSAGHGSHTASIAAGRYVSNMTYKLKAWLEDGKDIRLGDWKAADVEILNTFQLLTAKPVVYLVNMNERDYQRKKNKFLPKIHAWVQEHGGEKIIPFSCALERNLADLPPDEAAKYCEENKVECALPKIIKTGFSAINLIYFFTAGPDEVKCWQIRRLSKAPQAAGTIHTDFERGFICAEVMKFEDLKELGSEPAVKAAGKYRQEGKTYVVQDGDIIFFKFNVSGGGKK